MRQPEQPFDITLSFVLAQIRCRSWEKKATGGTDKILWGVLMNYSLVFICALAIRTFVVVSRCLANNIRAIELSALRENELEPMISGYL